MRIGVVSDFFRHNGAGLMALRAADMLTDAGHEVVILGGSIDASLLDTLRDQHGAASSFTHDERLLDILLNRADAAVMRRGIRRWLDEHIAREDLDVVYVHNCGRLLNQLELAELSTKIPVAHTMHDEWFFSDAHYTYVSPVTGGTLRTFEPATRPSLLEHRWDHLFGVPAAVGDLVAIGPSDWITERARRVFPGLDVVHIPNSVDADLFDLHDRAASRQHLGLNEDVLVAMFVGNPVEHRKGFAAFEQAALAASDRVGPILRLVVGGQQSTVHGNALDMLPDGRLAEFVKAAPPRTQPRLAVAGDGLVLSGIDRSWMPLLYGVANIVVHPSRIDNLPTVPIEAGLCGTRCLASDVGGTRETIADIADLFPLDIDSVGLGERVESALIESGSETSDLRRARRQVQLDRFGITTHRAHVLATLSRLIDGSRRGTSLGAGARA